MNYYGDLELNKNASEEEIRKSYRKLSLKYHPDKPGGSAEKFKVIQKAYEVLTDPDKKSYYDNTGQDPDQRKSAPTGFSAADIFASMFGAGIFTGMHGMGQPTINFDVQVECTYDELIYGAKKTAKYNGQKKRNCNCTQIMGNMIIRHGNCNRCNGRGIIIENVDESELNFDIPEKSHEGKILTVNGINIQLIISDTKDFIHRNNYIIYKYKINIYQALLGVAGQISYGKDQFEFQRSSPISPSNESNPNANNIVISGKGLYDMQGNRGDLIIVFEIEFPKSLVDRDRNLIKILNDNYILLNKN